MAAFLLTGCFDMSNRYTQPDTDTSAEDMEDEDMADEGTAEEETEDEEGTDEETEDVSEEGETDDTDENASDTGEGSDDEMTDDEEEIEDETEAESAEEEAEETGDDNDIFIQAFLNKYPDWEEKLDTLELTVDSNDGAFASGGVRFTDEIGGAAWFAANTDDGWVIAWDGNGTIGCAEIEPYDFPLEMIPECWDDENQVMVDRSEEGQAEGEDGVAE